MAAMAARDMRRGEAVDYKALHGSSTADIYSVNGKKSYRPKSKVFQVERLLSRRKSGNVSTKYFCLFLISFSGVP